MRRLTVCRKRRRRLGELMANGDPDVAERVTKAFLAMTKFEIAELEHAVNGVGAK